MASLSVGSNNFPTRVYENPPELVDWLASEMVTYGVKPEIEAFDLSHILKAHEMWTRGQIVDRPYVQFVMGVKNAMPADAPRTANHSFTLRARPLHFSRGRPLMIAPGSANPAR